MTAAQRMTGNGLFLQWIDGTGTVNFAGDQRAFTADFGIDTVDLAAGSDSYHYNYGTLKDWSGKLEELYIGSNGTARYARLEEGDTGTLVWGPLGSATGKPKWGIGAIVTKVSQSIPFDKELMISTEFKVQGTLVFNGNSATF